MRHLFWKERDIKWCNAVHKIGMFIEEIYQRKRVLSKVGIFLPPVPVAKIALPLLGENAKIL
jgi:hypothetical protein